MNDPEVGGGFAPSKSARRSAPVECLHSECDGTVRFDLDTEIMERRTGALSSCTQGHLHYSFDGMNYGTALEDRAP